MVVSLFVWMEAAERRAARLAGADGSEPGGHAAGPRLVHAAGLAIGATLTTSALALVLLLMRREPPGDSLVITYLLAAGAAVVWAGWSAPRRLPASARRRMGAAGRGALRLVFGLVLLWGAFFAGMELAQGVILPGGHLH